MRRLTRGDACIIACVAMIAVVPIFFVGPAATTTARANELTCTSSRVTSAIKGTVEGTNMLGWKPKVFELYDYRSNPDLGGKPEFMTDVVSPCKVTLMTDRGEIGFSYRWKIIDGKGFLLGQLGEPN